MNDSILYTQNRYFYSKRQLLMDNLTRRKIINFVFNSWSICVSNRTPAGRINPFAPGALISGVCNSVTFRRSIQIRLLANLTEGLAAALHPDVLDADIILVGRCRDVVDGDLVFLTIFGLDREHVLNVIGAVLH